ncbi:MAG: BsuBI/PstI family type II restriction endonuclease [Ignavibacteriales bacterium]|nr:BsuBI/PstI family type II restriction endonuclease [Ignavibacteriales bacterium]
MKVGIVIDFKKRFIKKAKKIFLLDKSINAFCREDTIYIIFAQSKNGIVSEEQKDRILSYLKNWKGKVVFFTLFNDRNELSKISQKISWGSYIWLRNDPDHTIHFNGDKFLG